MTFSSISPDGEILTAKAQADGGHRQSTPSKDYVRSPRRVIRLAEVLLLTGIKSRETIRSLERRGLFPKRFPLIPGAAADDRSTPKGWAEAEALRWIEAREASREQGPS